MIAAMQTYTADAIISVDLAGSHLDAIRALADELETADQEHPAFDDVPLWSDVLINSGGEQGWMVAVDRWCGLMGRAEELQRLCASLVAVGRKREREIAGRIKLRARYRDDRRERPDTNAWPGVPPERKPSVPKSIEGFRAPKLLSRDRLADIRSLVIRHRLLAVGPATPEFVAAVCELLSHVDALSGHGADR